MKLPFGNKNKDKKDASTEDAMTLTEHLAELR